MDFFKVVANRHAIRGFDRRPVEEEKLRAILEAANAAPSAGNRQAYDIYVVTDVRKRSALCRAAGAQGFVLTAPVCLVFCASPFRNEDKYGSRGRNLYSVQDATIACCFAMLAAVAQGLATVWTGAFDPDEVREVIGAPEDSTPVAILPVGYGAAEPEPRDRRPLEDLVHRV
jgi:nitroreductase